MTSVFIVSAARTPIGSFQGALASVAAPTLGSVALQAALERSCLPREAVSEVYMGNVLVAGLGQAPARQALRAAGLPDSVPATGVSKVCGSGLTAVLLGTRAIQLGDADAVLAGGMESMSRAPYLLEKARAGYRMGHGQVLDSMILDGLWDPYNDFHMGHAGELCATEYALSRDDQDAYAAESYRRALEAQTTGAFLGEIAEVRGTGPNQTLTVSADEEPGRANLERMPSLRGAFDKDGTITAANASKISDGAAAVMLASEHVVQRFGLEPLARVVAYAGHAQAPERFTTAPVGAIARVLHRAQLKAADIDLWEINEAFAVVALACAQQANVPHERLNVRGGAIALGHPIGASGARILTTLLYAMRDESVRRGLATLCIGGGEAVAIIVERV